MKCIYRLHLKLSFVFLVLFSLDSFSQQVKTVGFPSIRNFSPKEYGAKDQNWDIIQDKRGILYIANALGLLEYDGVFWKLIEMPNRSEVNSLCMDTNGRIYVGALNELGYLSSDSVGNTQYNSLVHLIPENERNFVNVWEIFCLSNKIIFSTNAKLIILENGTIKIIKPYTSFHLSYNIKDKIYTREVGKGIRVFDGNSFTLLKDSEIFANERIYVMCPFDTNKILIGTRNQNFFIYDGHEFSKFQTSCEDILKSGQLYCGSQLNDSIYAIGTALNGLLLIHKSGKLIKRLDKASGLISNEIHSVFSDKSKNLWLANGIGISNIEINSPFTYFYEINNLEIKSLVIFNNNNKIFIGGLPFLFYIDLNKMADAKFFQIEKSSYQVWKVFHYDNKLFIAQNPEQGFIDENNTFSSISNIGYVWTYCAVPDKPDYLILGANDGMFYFNKINNQWILQGRIEGFDLVSRYIETDSLSNLWVQVPNKGVYKLRLNEKGDRITDQKFLLEYNPLSKCIYNIDNQMIVTNNNIFLKYNYATEKFDDYQVINRLIPNSKNLAILGTCKNSDIYLQDNISIGKLIKKNKQEYSIYRMPFLALEKMTSEYPVLDIDESNTLIGRDRGFVHYQPNYIKDYAQPFNTLIRKVQILRTDSNIFGGNFPVNNDTFSLNQPVNQIPVLKYTINSLRFLYSAAFYENPEKTEYQYQLIGYENDWSAWTTETKKEYTNLNEGNYAFKVKARNVYGTESPIAVYEFIILPPWYRTWWAYILYTAFLIIGIWGIVYWRSQRLLHEKRLLESLVAQKTSDLLQRTSDLSQRTYELTQKEMQLEKIDLIVRAINSKIQIDDFLNSLLNEIAFAEKIQNAAVLMYNASSGTYQFTFARGWITDKLKSIELTPEEAESRYAPAKREAGEDMFLINQMETDASSGKYKDFVPSQSMLTLRIRNKETISGYIIFYRMKDEEPFVDADVQMLSNLRQHIIYGFTKAQLVTHLQQANDELKVLNDTKSEFLGIAAHDLRNPLSAIIGFIDLLIMDMKAGQLNIPEAVKDLEMVMKSAGQMVNLITELLDISAIESGKINLDLQCHNLNLIFEDCERIHRKYALKKNIHLIVDKDESLPEVVIDKSRIAEVVDNLLSNAIKYTFPGGKVILFTELQPKELHVHIRDSGQGLNEDDLKHIFRSYKKLSTRPTGGESSTGFGLAIVKKIVELHHGRVWVESQVNKGSTFSFSVPRTNE